MIQAFDEKQELDKPVQLVTTNVEGVKRYWYADQIEDFHKVYADGSDGPDWADEVATFSVNGNIIQNIHYYMDIVLKYGFKNPYVECT